jgi:hypothetical protein
MQHYRFALRTNGTCIEELGGIALATDDEALDFGEQLARGLMHYAEVVPPLIIDILAPDRTVAGIPFHPAAPPHSS